MYESATMYSFFFSGQKNHQQSTISYFFTFPKKKQCLQASGELYFCEAKTLPFAAPDPSTAEMLLAAPRPTTATVPLAAPGPTTVQVPVPIGVPGPVLTPSCSNRDNACYDISYHIEGQIDDFTKINLLENHWFPETS